MVDVQMGVLFGGRAPFEVDDSEEGHFNWMISLIFIVLVVGIAFIVYKKVIKSILRKRRQKLS
jgi:hypothetical protein